MAVEPTFLQHVLDWTGCAFGLIGAYLLAARLRVSRYGWFAFFAANLVYIALASRLGVWGFLAQQVGFLGSSAVGIFRNFVSPSRDRVDQKDDDVEHQVAWGISMRLAAMPPSYLVSAPPELALLIEQAKSLHPVRANGALDRKLRGESSELID